MTQSADPLEVNSSLLIPACDNTIRWQAGERLHQVFEERCDRFSKGADHEHIAIDSPGTQLSYGELDARANQLAHYLRDCGVQPGARIGLLFDKSYNTHIALLAVLKIDVAFVPLDASFPAERIAYIVEDAQISAFVTLSSFTSQLEHCQLPVFCLDRDAAAIARHPDCRIEVDATPCSADALCYIIYTSGTTGKPKGVAIDHSSIVNFVRVAAEVYGYRPDDRVYQGMTIAFDFSVEELWVPLACGATLVPCPPGTNLVGKELATFIREREINCMCCVPTLLATIDEEIENLRLLLVSGEACSRDLIAKWHRPGRRILNVYGPTEATVTATWSEPDPNEPITIGVPLPTYSIAILDDTLGLAAPGAAGEICIAGIGLAQGYLNRPDLTEKAFIDDFVELANNPSGRLYRTGDLGRITESGEIEFLGRIDTQVKIRGYRIELAEIESVIKQVSGIAQTVVDTHHSDSGLVELVAYCVLDESVSELPRDALAQTLRERLPAYMIPAYVETLTSIPMSTSHKADRKALPPPAGARFIARTSHFTKPVNATERHLARLLADALCLEDISTTDNFFEDLGAHSLLMAQFCNNLLDEFPHCDVSMRDIYEKPTIAELAEHVQGVSTIHTEAEPHRKPSTLAYFACGAMQIATYALYLLIPAALVYGVAWTISAQSWIGAFARINVFGWGIFIGGSLIPVLAKWLLIGRFKPERIPIWSWKYYRFWVVRTLLATSPMMAFKGLPIYNLYLRLLGARIGKHVVFFGKSIPVCTDLLEVGDGAIIRRDVISPGYRAQGGYLYTGKVKIGQDAYVAPSAILDIDTELGDRAQLGHMSSLACGQRVAAGQHVHGSPAVETSSDYCQIEPKTCTSLRRYLYTLALVAISITVLGVTFATIIYLAALFAIAAPGFGLSIPTLAVLSIGSFMGAGILNLLVATVVPRILNRAFQADRVYVLFGFHYLLATWIGIASNSRSLNRLFGDSSAIVGYLRRVGYDMRNVIQTGSNFGLAQRQDNPCFLSIGTGTMVADGLAISNMNQSSTSFSFSNASIGERNYLGNHIHVPANAKIGDNVLLATKVLVPIDGPVAENTGLLGSPSFRIPRMVDRDRDMSALDNDELRDAQLGKKNRHNFVTASTLVGMQLAFWMLAWATVVVTSYTTTEIWAYVAALAVVAASYLGYCIALERLGMSQARLEPQITSIYDRRFWRVERYWKYSRQTLDSIFVGTPLRCIIMRVCGVKVGKKVFDDGLYMSEKPMADIGDYCTLNAGSALQSHSLEEGVFKCDRIKVDDGCTVGINTLIHYGSTLQKGSIVETDAFFMKGGTAKANTVWRGNPAKQV